MRQAEPAPGSRCVSMSHQAWTAACRSCQEYSQSPRVSICTAMCGSMGQKHFICVAGPRRRVPSFVPDMGARFEDTEPGHVEELLTSEDQDSSPEREVEPLPPSSDKLDDLVQQSNSKNGFGCTHDTYQSMLVHQAA